MKLILMILLGPLVIKLAFRILGAIIGGMARSGGPKAPPVCRLKVLDGDTVFTRPGDHTIRLYGIDAPEAGQAQGGRSTEHLRYLTENEEVDVQQIERDRYGRIVARLIRRSDNLDINGAMVADGYAIAETRYTNEYVPHQKRARKNRLGLWRDGGIQDPQRYRAHNSRIGRT